MVHSKGRTLKNWEKGIFSVFTFLSLFIFTSWIDSNYISLNSLSLKPHKRFVHKPKKIISNSLKYLVLRNFAGPNNNQLKRLLSKSNGDPYKIVFQTFITEEGEVNLTAQVANTKNQAFDFQPEELEVTDQIVIGNITGKKIRFGQQEISKNDKSSDAQRTKVLKKLRDFANRASKNEVLIFGPRIDANNQLVYDLYAPITLKRKQVQANETENRRKRFDWKDIDFDDLDDLNISLNPSPPRNAE